MCVCMYEYHVAVLSHWLVCVDVCLVCGANDHNHAQDGKSK